MSKGSEKIFYLEKSKLFGLTAASVSFCLSYQSILLPRFAHPPLKLKSIGLVLNSTQEFLSPNFHDPKIMPFKYLMLLMIAIVGMNRKGLDIVDLLLILCFTSMALYAVRFIPIFAIIVLPIIGRQTKVLLSHLQGKIADLFREESNKIASVDAAAKGYIWVVGAVLMVIVALASGRLEYNFDREKMPLAAVDFLKKIDLRGNMFIIFTLAVI